MEINEKKQILKYFKNCITEDTKEELSIEIESKKLNKINSNKIFFPDKDVNYDFNKEINYTFPDLENFYSVLQKDWINKEVWSLNLEKVDEVDLHFKELFLEKCFHEYKINQNWDKKNILNKNIKTLIDFIKWDNNPLRKKIIKQINNHIYYLKTDKEYLNWEKLEKLFYSWDNKEDIEKIEFFWNLDFIDFYDTNKTEKIYLCLENVITERNKKLIFQPLYFIEVEIEENTKEHYFTLSLSESNLTFNFYVEYYKNKLFKLENKQEKEEWFELENDIEWLTNFESKINLYKSKIKKSFDKNNINKSISLISANDIAYIKWLLKEYNQLIDDKDLSNTKNTWLGFMFNETNIEKNHIDKLTNFTLLNKEQNNSVKESLENNLSIIVWPPWTWKSQVVVNIMLNAYINNKTVLFASKNNTAVDTVLDKVSKLDLSYYPFLRLGSKQSQDEWGPKIINKLKQNTLTNTISYNNIEDILENLWKLEDNIKQIEEKYLKYYENYEDLEIILNNYDEKFKEYLHKEDNINIDFNELKNYLNKYHNTLNKYNESKEELTKKDQKIKDFLSNNNSLKKLSEKIKNKTIEKVNFQNIIYKFKTINNELNKLEKKYNSESKKLLSLIKKNNYNFYLNKVSDELKNILIKDNFIDYNDIKISTLKLIWWELEETESFGIFKKLFGIQKKWFKENRVKYYEIIDKISNEKLKSYFLDIPESIINNSKLKDKIKEIIDAKDFEKTFTSNKKYSNELKNLEEYFNINKKELDNKINDITEELNNLYEIDFNNIKYKEIESIFSLSIELFWLENEYIIEKNNLNIIESDINNIKENIINFLQNNVNEYIYNYFLQNNSDFDYILKDIPNIINLEKINIKKEDIKESFNSLIELWSNITNINKQIFEVQKTLQSVSLDYISYKIWDNIKEIKEKLTLSVNNIYNVFSFRNDWNGSKDNYLVEKFKKIFDWIKIFITTNLSTFSLPLEEWFFDYLIIDEASQNDIASILPLLYRVKNVIIIWDPNQLQNIIKLDKKNIIRIFDTTLKKWSLNPSNYAENFKDIYNFQNSVFKSFESIYIWLMNKTFLKLNEHYRCHSDIINYSNYIISDYNLFPKVYQKNKSLENTWIPLWINWVWDIKTDNIQVTKRNESEAEAIIKYLKEIISILWNQVSIWVIAPFRNQVNYIKQLIRENWLEEYDNILVDTVHKFQWDEKDIILFSTVYPNAKASTFLNNVNLLNVAVSRARNSFLIFWDKQAIKSYKSDKWEELLYNTLIHYIESLEKSNDVVKNRKYDTEYEKLFFEELEKAGIKFDYQYQINEWEYNLDFRIKLKWANNYLDLELDWWVHDKQKSYDYTRNTKVEKLWYKVIRYSNSYMMRNMWEIIEWLKKICEVK